MASIRRIWDQEWSSRPFEEASSLNPAFCGELIARTIADHVKAKGIGLSFPLAFLVLPLVLHANTRGILPKRASTSLAAWASEQNPFLVGFPEKIIRLTPVTREALMFSINHKTLELKGANIVLGTNKLRLGSKIYDTTNELEDIRLKAAFVGRWFATQDPLIVMQSMGVRP